jgi:hypothetical protein
MPRLFKAPQFSGFKEWNELVGREIDKALESLINDNNYQQSSGSSSSGGSGGGSSIPSSVPTSTSFKVHSAPVVGTVVPGDLVSLLPSGSVQRATAASVSLQAHGICIGLFISGPTIIANWVSGGTVSVPEPLSEGSGRVLYLSATPGRYTADIAEVGKEYTQQIGLNIKPLSSVLREIDIVISPPSNI